MAKIEIGSRWGAKGMSRETILSIASGGWRVTSVSEGFVCVVCPVDRARTARYPVDTFLADFDEVESAPVEPDAHAVRVALEERLDKVERARVYAEDQARHCRSELEAERRKVERLEQSIASRDEKERGKVRRQAETIKSLEAKNAKLVEKVAAQWARAEESKSAARRAARASQTSEDRQTIASLSGEVARLQGIVADHERWRRSISLLFFRHGRDETPWEWIRERVDSAGDVLVALRAYARSDIRFSRVLEALREHDRKGGE